MKQMNLTINSIKELKFVASDEPKDFFILLRSNLKARKRIFYDENSDAFLVEDLNDGERETYSIYQLGNETNIVEAIERGAFFLETTEIEAANLRTSLALSI